jgi:hypothetical protein
MKNTSELEINNESQTGSDEHYQDSVSPMPVETLDELDDLAEKNGGHYKEPEDYKGSIGRTLFDSAQSEDGTITIVMPSESIDQIPAQSLVRILSKPDGRIYVGMVISGPFAEPDGMRAESPSLVISAVNKALMMPKFHGRMQVSLMGEQLDDSRLIPPRLRPKPNSPVWVLPDDEMARILEITGEMRFGIADGHESIEMLIPARKKSVLPRHQGILGTTGGGKSTTVSVEIDNFQKAGIATIVLDTEGEYTTINNATDNETMLSALRERGLEPRGVANTHLYHLTGRECANPDHPDIKEFSLRLANISPWAFKEIMDLNEAQEDRLLQAYEIAKSVMRQLQIFPRAASKEKDEQLILDLDEFDRGWPLMTLEHLLYVVSGIINLHEKKSEEPWVNATGFKGKWNQIRGLLHPYFEKPSKKSGDDTDFSAGNIASWKKLSSKISRLTRLKIFDRPSERLNFNEMLESGRVNIIDLSDLENTDVRNLAIAEILRGVQTTQEKKYNSSLEAGSPPTPVNIIIEEAHEFLSVHRIKNMPIMREQVEKIAKRGRKRYLGLTFVTQLPQHLPDEILALLNNWVLHKVSDASVISRLRRSIHGVDDRLWSLLPGLAAGQAVMKFEHVKRALVVSVDPSACQLRMVD